MHTAFSPPFQSSSTRSSTWKKFHSIPRSSTPSSTTNPTKPPSFKMGRLHSKGKGIASSALPYSRSAPSWLKTTREYRRRKGEMRMILTPFQLSRLSSRSASSPRRVLPPPRLVLSSVTPTVLPRSSTSLVCPRLRKRLMSGAMSNSLRIGNKILRILKSSGTPTPLPHTPR